MSDLERAVAAFATADVAAWPGLPADVHLSDLRSLLAFDPDDVRRGDAGDPSRSRTWVPAETATYQGGLRIWLDDDGDRVLLLEGVHPLDAAGEPLLAPDLGAPGALLDAFLGPFHVPDAEQVYAVRGLALQVYADTGLLVGVLGFTPTASDDYRRNLQPHREPTRPYLRRVTP